ncbi:succinate dehydrogenase, hydrophobic membrane anchor protein [Pseudoxanthomonas yeongjuensis]|uniref:succinate dehydrogenase, hydrophobic membrane anchor protein n=1 Tax=Pseudoxanthomonas yeongjuensis TaxID=377616 RepID=UPI0013918AE4|nr:succinate dehydrogenase, hydrophobic membrane anchor protein [Pseudoxanthomonas yeongjuensis]KAF1718034.1 succinate dehydrogenase, hydrophobic membrane anchor protein [Pseudoxanthomonas yeongjuensis]
MSLRYRTPLKVAKGLGSAKEGTGHFLVQRLTAIALVFLACWFVYFVVGLMHADYLTATDAVARPWNAMLLIAFLVAMFWHAQLGVQVVIEDYVHSHGLALTAQIAVRFVCILGALASVFAVVRIALGN